MGLVGNVDVLKGCRAAGIGVAMGNAIPAVKEAADEIAPPCEENGFAEAVRKFVLEGNT